MKQAVGSGEMGALMGSPYLSHEPLVDCGAPAEPTSFFMTEVTPSVLEDDCESSTHLATEMRQTLVDFPANTRDRHCPITEYTAALAAALREWPVFASYTPRCVDLMSRICHRGTEMLKDKSLRISCVVGMSSEPQASADSIVKTAPPVYGGHCFNVGRYFHQNGSVDCFLLEGTAPMDEFHVESLGNAVRIPVQVMLPNNTTGSPPTWSTQVMMFHDYLTLLGRTVCRLTQVINTPNGGGRSGNSGIPVEHISTTRGWLSSTVFSPSLKSDRGVQMNFYHRIVYTGMSKDIAGVQGCLPVEQNIGSGQEGFIAGCHPYSLNDMDLQGLDVAIPGPTLDLMRDVMNEAHPPLVDHAVFRRLSALWGECSPLVSVNVSAHPNRLKGCDYMRIACMETPAIPELCGPICMIKTQVCQLANEINRAKPNTDHAYFVWSQGSDNCMKKEGTGCHLFVDVPVRACPPTIIHSLRSALKRLNYPGYIPIGDEI